MQCHGPKAVDPGAVVGDERIRQPTHITRARCRRYQRAPSMVTVAVELRPRAVGKREVATAEPPILIVEVLLSPREARRSSSR